jgi:hypothetical protein
MIYYVIVHFNLWVCPTLGTALDLGMQATLSFLSTLASPILEYTKVSLEYIMNICCALFEIGTSHLRCCSS